MTDQTDWNVWIDPDGHPSLDQLADLHAGVPPESTTVADSPDLSGAAAAAAAEDVQAHVAGCPVCRDHLQALDQVSAALAAAPLVGLLPEDVRLRLDTALAEAGTGSEPGSTGHDTRLPSTTVVPLRRGQRGGAHGSAGEHGPRGIRVLQVAAATVLVLGVGAVGYGAVSGLGGNADSSGSATSAGASASAEGRAADSAAAFPLTASGRDWEATGVRAAVPRLATGSLVRPLAAADLVSPLDVGDLAGTPLPADASRAPDPGSGTGSTSAAPSPGDGSSEGPKSSAVVPASRLAGGPALAACVQALLADATITAGPVGTITPLAVDLARWQQQPAAVILLPAIKEPTRIELWVVGEDCGPSDAKVLYFADVAR